MPLPFLKNQFRIGVSISDDLIEMVEVRVGRAGSVTVTAASQVKVEPGVVENGKVLDVDRLAASLKAAHEAAKPTAFSTDAVAVALPDSVTYFHIFRLPGALSDDEVQSALAFQSEEFFPFPSGSMMGDFAVVARSSTETVVQYAVALRESVSQFQMAVERANLKLVGLGLEAPALIRALLAGPREKKASLVVDIGARSTTVFIRDAYGLVATFVSHTAGQAMTEAVAKAKKVSMIQAESLKRTVGLQGKEEPVVRRTLAGLVGTVAAQIGKAIDWYKQVQSDVELDEVVVTGGTSLMPGLMEELTRSIAKRAPNVKVRRGEPFARIPGDAAFFAPALGMALHGRGEGGRSFEFLPAAKRGDHTVASKYIAAEPQGLHRVFRDRLRMAVARVPQRTKETLSVVFIVLALILFVSSIFWRINVEKRADAEIAAMRAALRDAERRAELVTSPGGSLIADPFEVPLVISARPTGSDIPGRLVRKDAVTYTVSVTPYNRSVADAVATGTVTITNAGSTDQSLVATTRLLSSEGVLFRLRDAVVVPAGGSVDAVVYADVSGVSGDIGPTHFTLPGLNPARQTVVYADSAQAMSGGTVAVGILTQDDVDAAVAQARTTLAETLADLFETELEEGERFDDALTRITVTSQSASVEVGARADRADVTAVFRVESLVFPSSDLTDAVNQAAAELADVNLAKLLENGDIREVSIRLDSASDTLDRVEITVTAQFYPHPS